MNTAYVKKKVLGEGTYAVIYLADEVHTTSTDKILKTTDNTVYNKQVAIKKIKTTNIAFGIEMSSIREIKALKKIKSPYVLHLFDIFIHNNAMHIILEYIETNLEVIIKNKKIILMPSDIKSWLLMILKGLYAIHRKFVIHRDIKPNNILIDRFGIVKIADFGLAREIDYNMTPTVVTRWYRAPELLFNSKMYTFGVDMWAVGCVFAELFLRVPLFGGESDFHQLELIFQVLGNPEKSWKQCETLNGYVKYKESVPIDFATIFTGCSEDALDLLKKMLMLDPKKRITCLNALKHEYFTNMPRPTEPEKLPYYEADE